MNNQQLSAIGYQPSANRGAVLIIALMVMFALFLFGVTTLTRVTSAQKTMAGGKESTQAFYLAEAGIERALWRLGHDRNWGDITPPSNLYTDEPLGEGTYTVVLKCRTKNDIQIESTGKVGNSQRTVRVKIRRVFGG